MQENSRPPFFPMMIDLQGKKVLIIGGGQVASRRARTLITCGAEITAVSPEFCDDFPDNTQKFLREFKPEDITGDFVFVIAATNSREINKLVYDAAKKNITCYINSADCPEECDFFFPSLIASGSAAASVCTAGVSSSLTRRLSDKLRKVWSLWVQEEAEINEVLFGSSSTE